MTDNKQTFYLECLKCGSWFFEHRYRGGAQKYCKSCAAIVRKERTKKRVAKYRAKHPAQTTSGKSHGLSAIGSPGIVTLKRDGLAIALFDPDSGLWATTDPKLALKIREKFGLPRKAVKVVR